MRMLVPAGWMIDVAGGPATITMCTGQGVQIVQVAPGSALDHRSPGHHADDHAHTACPYTAVAAAATLDAGAAAWTPSARVSALVGATALASALRVRSVGPRFATGPPRLI